MFFLLYNLSKNGGQAHCCFQTDEVIRQDGSNPHHVATIYSHTHPFFTFAFKNLYFPKKVEFKLHT